jgi:hypothetical protein
MATVTQTRNVTGFSEVEIQAIGDVLLEQGDTESLIVEADEAFISRIKTEVRGRRLVLGWDVAWWEWLSYWWFMWLFIPNKRIVYRVRLKTVTGLSIRGSGTVTGQALQIERCELSISGSGRIQLDAITAQSLHTSITGSGDVELNGSAQQHDLRISGSGKARLSGLQTQQVTVTVSGSGSAWVDARQDLKVTITGSGEVEYAGQYTNRG